MNKSSPFLPGIDDLFILHCHDRSGSNLARVILSTHPDIYVVPPLHIFDKFLNLIPKYGDLNDDALFDILIKDVVSIIALNEHPLPYDITAQDLQSGMRGRNRTIGQIAQLIIEILTLKSGARVGAIKSGIHPNKLEIFLTQTRFSKCIFQYRDPRDVVASTLQAGRRKQGAMELAQRWGDWHVRCRALLKAAFPASLHDIRYEDILSSPDSSMAALWDFIGLAPYPQWQDFHRQTAQKDAAKASYMWQNLAQPLDPDNVEKFYRLWNWADIKNIEDILGSTLSEFGYAPAQQNTFLNMTNKPTQRPLTSKDKQLNVAQNEAIAEIRNRLSNPNA